MPHVVLTACTWCGLSAYGFVSIHLSIYLCTTVYNYTSIGRWFNQPASVGIIYYQESVNKSFLKYVLCNKNKLTYSVSLLENIR